MKTREKKSARRPRYLPCLLLGLLLSGTLPAQEPPAPEKTYQLTLPNGRVFHETSQPVHGQSTLGVPGSDVLLHVWQEELPSGELQSYYAFSRGGTELRGRVRATTHKVRLRDVQFDPLVEGPPGVSVALAARTQNRLYLVQLEATPLPEMRRAITDLGGKVLRFLTDHTFLVEMTPQVRAQVQRLEFVRWIGPYHAAYRLEKPLRDAIESAEPLAPQRYSILLGERGVTQAAVAARIRALGGVVELIEPGGMRVEATLTRDQLLEVAHFNEVQFIDRWGGPGETDMDVVRAVGGADYVESVGGYTGQGVRGEVFDTELLLTHQEWGLSPILHSSATPCSSLHGTSVYSNNFATGVSADARGVVPDAQGIFFRYCDSTQFGGPKSRYDANGELIDPAGPYRAVYQTSSVGSARTLDYTTISAEVDDYLFLHQLLSTQSQSNAGNQYSRPQAWAKNIVSVGGIRHYDTADRCDDNWSFGASIGPAADGRIKPDLSFFYDSIWSASGGGNTSYTNFGGTSSATPQTAGYFGLLFQMWHAGVWSGHGGGVDVFDRRPKMATAKALMINNAFRYDWTHPGGCAYSDVDRFKQGWGNADARRLRDRATVTDVIDETDVISPLQTKRYDVTVAAGQSELDVTLVYVDPAGTAGAAESRVNDLSLRVTAPGGTVYWGNHGLTAGNWSTPGGSSNTVDTVENVFLPNPAAGAWIVEVIADEIVEDAHQETAAVDADYALVINGGAIGGSPPPAAGVIGQRGRVSNLTDQPQTVLFGHSYKNPVVFAQPLTANGSDAAVVRITDVRPDRFTLYVDEPPNLDGPHPVAETVSYLVLEAGNWVAAGQRLSVGSVTTSKTVGQLVSNQWQRVNLVGFGQTPVILTQVQSNQDPSFVKTRVQNVSTTGFDVALEEEEASAASHGAEVVGWLAFKPGASNWDGGKRYEAVRTPTAVTHDWYTVSFLRGMSDIHFFAGIETYRGPDGSHLRYRNLTNFDVQVRVEEDTTRDSETQHTQEVVSYVAIAGSGTLSAVPWP